MSVLATKANSSLSTSKREPMRSIMTNWLHPTGFCPAYLTRRFGRCVSDPDMLDALDLGDDAG